MTTRLLAALALVLPFAGACATPRATGLVPARELPPASGAPTIDELVDLGGGDVPAEGELRLRPSDGVLVVGEALWIRGRGFGRQPSVTIGGRAAAVLSRTADGGILVRVPVGVASGGQPVRVTQEHGSTERPATLRRYLAALAPGGGRAVFAAVGPEGTLAAPTVLDVPGARLMALSADGRAAYLAGDGSALTVVELPAAGGPAIAGRVEVGAGPPAALLAAAAAHRLLLVRDDEVLVLDTAPALRPVRSAPRALPPTVRVARPVRWALSPDGRILAAAVADRNRIVLLDVERLQASEAAVLGEIALVPELRARVLVDLAFAHDGRTLWVAAGETADSRALGPQPTQLFALRLRPAEGRAWTPELARTVRLDEAAAPVALATSRSLPLASGAAVRLPPEKATVYLVTGTGVHAVGAEDRAVALLAAAGAGPAATDVTPDGRWVFALVRGGDGRLLLQSGPADGRPGAMRSTPVGSGAMDGGPATDGWLRVQP